MISFSVFGVQIKVRFSFPAVLCLMVFLFREKLGLWCVFLSLAHELGHFYAMALFRAIPREVVFSYEGISIAPSYRLLSTGREALVLLAGSGANFLIALLFLRSPLYCISSIVLGVFNLLPLRGLDGGKLLTLFSGRFPVCGESLCRAVSWLTGTALSLFAVVLFIQTGNFSLLLTMFYFLSLAN